MIFHYVTHARTVEICKNKVMRNTKGAGLLARDVLVFKGFLVDELKPL